MARKLPQIPDFRDLDRLIKATRTERERLMMMLARYLGLRVSEVCKLQAQHLDFSQNFLMVREGKGKKDRSIPIPAFLIGPLRGFIGAKTEGHVFPSPRGGRLTNRAVQLLVKRLVSRAGLKDRPRFFTPHKLRHQFISTMLSAGVPVHEARDLAGHSSIAVTDRYSHSSPEHLRRAIEKAA